MWPVCTKFVGLPIIDRSMRRRWWGARRREGDRCCWKQQENHCSQISPVDAIFCASFCLWSVLLLSAEMVPGEPGVPAVPLPVKITTLSLPARLKSFAGVGITRCRL